MQIIFQQLFYKGLGNPKQWFKHGTEGSELKYALNWSHVNRLTEITDRDTGEKYEYTYNPNGIAEINPFGYRGYYLDNETNLWYLNSRYYDSTVGRFISPDGLDYLDPESLGGLNLYAYCNNNPVMYYDPSGTLAILAILTIIGAVIGAIVGGLIAGFTAVNIFGTDNVGAIICSALLGVIFGAAVGALTGLIAGSFGPAVGGMAASGTTAALVGTKIGAWVLSGVAVASGVAVTVGGAKLIGNVNFSQWEPGSWPGDDPTVSPGDGFEWRGPGEVGSEFGEWYNPETKDQLHPNLNHPLPKGPHWGWRNKLRRILKDIFKV